MSPCLPFLAFLGDIPSHHLIIEIYWYHFIYQLPSSFYIRGRCSTWHLPQLQSMYIIPQALVGFKTFSCLQTGRQFKVSEGTFQVMLLNSSAVFSFWVASYWSIKMASLIGKLRSGPKAKARKAMMVQCRYHILLRFKY